MTGSSLSNGISVDPYIQPGCFAPDAQLHGQIVNRLNALCRRAVNAMDINLEGIKVLTEAANGPFAVTPVIAALAGARSVTAVCRDSRWGTAENAFSLVRDLAVAAGVDSKIIFSDGPVAEVAENCDLVTNLGFVRPIDRALISALSANACVSLMWEPWEFRADEIDVQALRDRNVALIATNEQHGEVRTFDYLGPTVARLLFDSGVEIVNARLCVLGSDPFGHDIGAWLRKSGADVERTLDASRPLPDAVIIAEHRSGETPIVVAGNAPLLMRLAHNGTVIIRLCGALDEAGLRTHGLSVYPPASVVPGTMSVTTAFAGPRPVVDLHAAGLKAGGGVIRARMKGATISEAIQLSIDSGFGLKCEM